MKINNKIDKYVASKTCKNIFITSIAISRAKIVFDLINNLRSIIQKIDKNNIK